MVNHKCINGIVDDTSYSSPMPAIGLYIASASLLCMLLMLCDIVTGFRARKRWLPCKFFTLNSVTLTLFSIAAKLPVDLTTPMPSPSDQLSKLSSTAFICICMCFLMPSLGVNPESDTFTNLVALTIFVVTVFVNVCIQLYTGVIVHFFVEHIIILCLLILLLTVAWHSYWDISNTKKVYTEQNKEIFTQGDRSLLQCLKTSYLFGYRTNNHFVACLEKMGVSGAICPLCFTILIQASFRSLILKHLEFCSGNSDYEWSIPAIIVTQILTVFVGNVAVTFRWLAMSRYAGFWKFFVFADKEADDVINSNPVLSTASRLDKYGRALRYAFLSTMQWLQFFILILPTLAIHIFMHCLSDRWDAIDPDEWTARKINEDMEIWMNQIKSEFSSNHLSRLLISRNYPYQQFDTMEVIDPSRPNQKGVLVSSLSIVLLVRISQVSLPQNTSTSLVGAFSEANQIFHYIEKRINPQSRENYKKLLFAESVWAGEPFNSLLNKIFNATRMPPSQSDLDRCLFIITKLKSILPSDPVWDELGIIVDFINRRKYSTLEELVTSVEQTFIDMVRVMLAQLPNAIFKSLSNSTNDEYEENVQLALKFVCKVAPVAAHIQWSFPAGCHFTSLATEVSSAADQADVIVQDMRRVLDRSLIMVQRDNYQTVRGFRPIYNLFKF